MSEVVVDSSALIEAFADGRDAPRWVPGGQVPFHAPHLIDLEFANVLRGLVRGGKLSESRADNALQAVGELRVLRYPHRPFLARIWDLGPNLSAYDAAYVALAEVLDLPLVTADARLARSSGHEAEIELI